MVSKRKWKEWGILKKPFYRIMFFYVITRISKWYLNFVSNFNLIHWHRRKQIRACLFPYHFFGVVLFLWFFRPFRVKILLFWCRFIMIFLERISVTFFLKSFKDHRNLKCGLIHFSINRFFKKWHERFSGLFHFRYLKVKIKKNRIMSKHPLSVVGILWYFEYMLFM